MNRFSRFMRLGLPNFFRFLVGGHQTAEKFLQNFIRFVVKNTCISLFCIIIYSNIQNNTHIYCIYLFCNIPPIFLFLVQIISVVQRGHFAS